jgi:hypothetical protein
LLFHIDLFGDALSCASARLDTASSDLDELVSISSMRGTPSSGVLLGPVSDAILAFASILQKVSQPHYPQMA